ncbi:Fibronectin type III domain-containing protein 3B [Chelonia mydas]|uniref:Fibronectin type III domain-containing protein 3B n=1 Tax=Chelonia mydas TaxID=8469 RepID=M7AUF2_CHEMY|nr:Fibronectin type III domain-containing protein 3B [Chelonia mydas]
MYVTMMMTDQIPLELPPLLNGEVAMMPHIVNGDGSQQVLSTLPAGSMGSDQSSRGRFIMSSIDAINRPPIALASTPILHLNKKRKGNRQHTAVKTPREQCQLKDLEVVPNGTVFCPPVCEGRRSVGFVQYVHPS